MLRIYENLFKELHNSHIQYCVYKGLNHLEEDLNGQRGDIDILIDNKNISFFTELVKKCNFFTVLNKSNSHYYMGIDRDTHIFVMLDISTKIPLGPKPYKPYYLAFDSSQWKIEKNSIHTLNEGDYISLLFLMGITSLSNKKYLDEIKEYLKKTNTKNIYFKNFTDNTSHLNWEEVSKEILKAQSWGVLRNNYTSAIVKTIKKDNLLHIKQTFKMFLGILQGLKLKIKFPPYRIRKKGHLIAFIGVDGAGKSSTVNYIENLDFFKYTGVKRIYFGSNEYWIPSLLTLLNKQYKNKAVKVLLSTLSLIDRRVRIYIAIYYMKLGNTILADRYFYDDMIGREINKERISRHSFLKKLYYRIFGIKLIKKPDLTIFLDVSPEVAYARKQDYSYDKMLKVNKVYKDYMYLVDDVFIVNADKPQKEIYSDVVEAILELDK